MNRKTSILILVLASLFVVSAGVAYYFGPQIKYQLRLAEWRSKYLASTSLGEIEGIHPGAAVNITNCKADPLTSYIFLGSNLRFINNDERNHKVFFRQKNFVVPAKSFTDAPLDFLSREGDRAYYDCDSAKYAGSVLVLRTVSSTTNSTTTKKTSI